MKCLACNINQTDDSRTYMCAQCRTDMRVIFDRIPDTIKALTALAGKTVRIGQRETGGRASFAPLPINEQAASLLQRYREWLQVADSSIQATRGLHTAADPEWHYTRIRHDWDTLIPLVSAPRLYADLKDLAIQSDRMLTPPETLAFGGICPTCGKPVYAKPGIAVTYCKCGNIINLSVNRQDAMRRLRAMRINGTPAQAAQWVKDTTGIDIKRNTIQQRIRRGTIDARPLGAGIYDISINDLITMANERTEK